jgi:anti-anti-sigma regulatory factor
MRASQMMESLLQTVVETGAGYVLVDLTGVDEVDQSTADHLIKLVEALSLVGARAVVSGIPSGVAKTMISLGLDLSRLATARNLKEAIRLCTGEAQRQRGR